MIATINLIWIIPLTFSLGAAFFAFLWAKSARDECDPYRCKYYSIDKENS